MLAIGLVAILYQRPRLPQPRAAFPERCDSWQADRGSRTPFRPRLDQPEAAGSSVGWRMAREEHPHREGSNETPRKGSGLAYAPRRPMGFGQTERDLCESPSRTPALETEWPPDPRLRALSGARVLPRNPRHRLSRQRGLRSQPLAAAGGGPDRSRSPPVAERASDPAAPASELPEGANPSARAVRLIVYADP